MAFANYTEFRNSVLKMIDGDDVGTSFSVDTLDLLISLGESLVYLGDTETGGLRSSNMRSTATLPVTGNVATLPADLLELAEVRFVGHKPLDIVPLARVREFTEAGLSAGNPAYAAQDGDTLVFWPQASSDVSVTYYKRPEPLKTGTWAGQTTIERYPDPFLYAALMVSAPFIGEDMRIPVWAAAWRSAMRAAQRAERARVYGGGSLRVRTR